MSRQRISLRQELPLLVWLVIVWGALWQDFSPGNLLFGALLAIAVARLFYLPPVELSGRFNIRHAIPFALMFLFRVVVASFQILYLAPEPPGPHRYRHRARDLADPGLPGGGGGQVHLHALPARHQHQLTRGRGKPAQ
jgi:hypothetical protein